ncbi:MAG: discoidin domain-containing protein [Bacteroidota bacterium]
MLTPFYANLRKRKTQTGKRIAILISLILTATIIHAQIKTLEEFENKDGWSFIRSDGVNLNLSVEKGLTGNAIRFDYDFTKGTGYGGIQKLFPIDLPDNYEFTFYVKADSPANNFEIKFIDSTGNNVWWVSNRNYHFPQVWKKICIKKRHINFAWGPTTDQHLKRIDRIEFTIASFVGGKGTIWIDDLKFEPLAPEALSYPGPSVSASSSLKNHSPEGMIDHADETYWQSNTSEKQLITIDFKTRREFGGLQINWLKDYYAKSFDVLLSDDGKKWEKVYSVQSNQGDVSYIRLPEAEARYLRIDLSKSKSQKGFGIMNLRFPDVKRTLTPNDFLIYTAKNSPTGNFPRYFLDQASYWTITGVNNDVKEALINEDGMVEVDKAQFSIEPMIKMGDSLYNWSNVKSVQSLGTSEDKREFNFVPSVTWRCNDLKFITGVTASGEANNNSQLDISYSFENLTNSPKDFEFYLLIRPYQVNPYYQFLNLTGGAGKINSIREADGKVVVVDNKVVLSQKRYDSFGASVFDDGNIVDLVRKGNIPQNKVAVDQSGLANGVIKYLFHLNPGEHTGFYVVVPFYARKVTAENPGVENVAEESNKTTEFWKIKTGHIKFRLPESANRIINTYRSNLAYILINRDKTGIQPGSRSYERSWIRDGALTSSALLKSGIVQEVKDFIDWYTDHQFENGKVPCVVDFRGPDPVPENDSHGEMIYLIREYFNFTKDTTFLRSKNKNVLKAVGYIESMVAERSTDHFKYGNDSVRAYYGLVTESISHEGYSAKPMHSYWDDFFTMKGLKDAVEIQEILGETGNYERLKKVRDTFRENLYSSILLAMKARKINYIPGCVELGDFDATSTTIALTPCNELINLPKPQLYNTFDKYYEFFKKRRDGKLDWINYTPYENRLIGSFIMLDQPGRAHELIDFFLKDQRPQGWNHWAEVVWKDYRTPRYIGDMPHTWVGSDFINAIRAMFVYENEFDETLVLASALYQDWIDAPEGMSVENLPTYYGEVSYSIKKDKDKYIFSISGDAKLPVNGIKIKNFNGSKLPSRVTVNGMARKDFDANEITVKELPAEVVIYY